MSDPTTEQGDGTKESPWKLTTPSGSAAFEAYRDETLTPPALVVTVGKTQLRYDLRCIADLHAMLLEHGDWMLLGKRRRTKAGGRRHGGSLGAGGEQPSGRVVRIEEGIARAVWDVCAAGFEGAGVGRGGEFAEE